MKFLAWKDDKWLSKNQKVPFVNVFMYDKLAHFLRESTLTFFPLYLLELPWQWIILVEIGGILYEIINGIIPYNKQGNIEGFSWKDLISNNAGIAFGFFLYCFL